MDDYTFLYGFTLMIRGLWMMFACLIRGLTILTIELMSVACKYWKAMLLGMVAILGALCVVPIIVIVSWLIV